MDRKKVICINKYSVLFFLLIVPLIPPEGLVVLCPSAFLVIFKIGKYTASIIIFLLFLNRLINGNVRISVTYCIVIIIFVWDLFITLVKNGNIKGCVGTFFSAVFLGMLVVSYFDKLKNIFNIVFIHLFILIIINGVCMILFPNGMYTSIGIEGYTANWLLGYKSSFQYYILPLICLALFRLINMDRIYSSIIAIVISHVETIASLNKMLLMGLLIIDIAVVYFYFFKGKYINAYFLAVVALIVNYILIFIPINKISIFSYIIGDILHKDITTGRISLWKTTLNWIKNSKVTGYGWIDNSIRYGMYRKVAHAHNQLLEFTFQGGVVLLILYIILIFYVAYQLNKNRKSKYTNILLFSLFSLYIMSTVEIFTRSIGTCIWLLFLLPEWIQFIDYDELKN